MPTKVNRPYVLSTLLQCQDCDSPMGVHTGTFPTDDFYRCARENKQPDKPVCAAPDLRAHQLETWLIQEITETIFTPENLRTFRRLIARAADNNGDIDIENAENLAFDPLTYIVPESISIAQRTFAKFVERISISAAQARVHYSIPLPADSANAGQRIHTVPLPAQILT